MNLKVFAIYDAKAESYLPPFHMTATGLALRAFQDMACDKSHQIGQHPEDYTLFELGEFDQFKGQYKIPPNKKPLGNALEYVRMRENET